MKLSEKARQIIGAVAPTIGAALGGPFGALAGKVLGNALGGDSKVAEEAILSGDPEALAKVKMAEIELQQRLQELGIEEQKLAYEDTASARAREMAVKDHTPMILAIGVTIGFFGVLLYMLVSPVPESGKDALLVMLGALGTAWANVIAYYFGSSAGSKDKTAALTAIAKQP